MAILNGKRVPDSDIDPEFHKFIGMFRRPNPRSPGSGYIKCGCGQTLQTVESEYVHWQQGHFDEPQYEDIHPGSIYPVEKFRHK